MGTTRAPTEVSWVAAKDVRRWIRSRQIAANGRLDPGVVYSVLLAVGMAVALLHAPIVAAIWPGTPPDGSGLQLEVLAGVGLVWAALYSVLRRLGPLTVSRSAATWLLPAPVSRRMLLTPSLSLAIAASAVIGAVTGLAVLGHAATRPVPAASVFASVSFGAAGAIAVALLALLCQRWPAVARLLDASGGAVVCGLLTVATVGAAGVPTESTHSEARSAALLRLLGLSGRRVVAQRLVVPSVLGALWCAAVMVALQAVGLLRGPWWALGLVAGPAVAVAAVQRAKASAASIANVLIDTPLGAFPAGTLLWLLNGLDVLAVLSLPLSVGLASHGTGEALSWTWVALQGFASAAGCAVMVRWSKT
nr:DUF6297 family protein [Phytohabitans suffuscus]